MLCFKFVFVLDWAFVVVDGFDSIILVSVRCEDAGRAMHWYRISITKNRPTHGLTVPDEHDTCITSFKRETWSRMKASDGPKGPGTTCFFFFSCFLFLNFLLHHR